MSITDDEIDRCYEVRDEFLNDVREAFRKAKANMTEEQFDYIVFDMQDSLSLFSPWMNN